MRRALLVCLIFGVTACAPSGWSEHEVGQVRNVCLNVWGGTTPQCECVVGGTEKAYPDFDDFSRSTTWSNELVSNLVPCGVGPLESSDASVATIPDYSPNYSSSCSSSEYRNVDGVCVRRPTKSPIVGYTARCRDGTYSYSKNRQGTCSHHGGVSSWG